MENQEIRKHTYASKIGHISLSETDGFITEIKLNDKMRYIDEPTTNMALAISEIALYLDGKLKKFSFAFKLEGSEYSKEILDQMLSIPYGETTNYKSLTKQAGYPNAFRACGTVCKNNKLPILFPCHRVIKSDGSLGNYNGGIALKKQLLDLEKSSN